MNTLKNLAGVLTFLTVFGLSTVVTKYLHTPLHAAVNVSRVVPASPETFVQQTATSPVSYRVQLVSLDFEAQKSYTTLTLNRDRNQPAPESLWVRTYFFRPDGSRVAWATDIVEFHQPFKNGNTVALTAAAPCSWCDESLAPGAAYYARVQISTRAVNDPLLHGKIVDDDIATALPVLVQNRRSIRY
jgi:hypothetical protein